MEHVDGHRTFALCIFGTFLTRSGIVSSVHAFTTSTLGPMFAIFLAIILAVSLGLVAWRLPDLRSANQLESVLSRESSFLFQQSRLVVSCFAVLWGTMFPVDQRGGERRQDHRRAAFFNRVNVPIFLLLLALTGVGPLIAWRRASWPSLRRAFVWPSVAGVGTMVVLLRCG